MIRNEIVYEIDRHTEREVEEDDEEKQMLQI